ncbi:class I SAM-dependent methyltransferase [Cesiribacter andamanensis]|uniref:Trans-aconitate methyltransferase n=1 Tax=Cesiribacter andamanensis AMV16 TaxID=1279009 RepID=M7MZV7_9BACT|nr:class I SAM-dependent methyltransferase [Cesiribacter andamanensis]EMR01968.1 Trans-aconitate methyltransferase [Cesiribacter andamanensis AMV16]
MRGNYDRIAPFYDALAALVFGQSIRQAQQFLLEHISANSRLLIVGGGTGWILEALTTRHPQGLEIDYVESSLQMLERSRQRNWGSNKVHFIHAPIQQARLRQGYAVVITPFVLDNFSASTLGNVMGRLDQVLAPGGLWLYADFRANPERRLQRGLLWTMYAFFALFCRLETRTLTDPHPYFEQYLYKEAARKHFYGGFINSLVYQKA